MLQTSVVVLCCVSACLCECCLRIVFLQAEDGIRDLVRSRGLGDVYKRQQEILAVLHGADAQRSAFVVDRRADDQADRGVGQQLSLIHI